MHGRPASDSPPSHSANIVPADPITIAFGIDNGFAAHMAAVIASLVSATREPVFRFLVLNEGVTAQNRGKCEAAAPGARFDWIDVRPEDFPEARFSGHFSRAILYRLALPRLAPSDCSRVIYLDADVIVNEDIRPLWLHDLGGCSIGAVEDCFISGGSFAEKWALPDRQTLYFNSGVLLIDLSRVRQAGQFSKALSFISDNAAELHFADQDALNWAFHGDWLRLEDVWNVQRHQALTSLHAELPVHRLLGAHKPAIVHFTGPEKPWKADGYHPWSWLYWRALEKTQFHADVLRTSGIGLLARLRMRAGWWLRSPG